jgi:hypothetical protein
MPQMESLKPEKSETSEPPLRSPVLFIGQNRRGCWVVQDQLGKRGGLFVSRVEAFRYAMFETDNCLQAIVMAPGLLELDLGVPTKAAANDSETRLAFRGRALTVENST